MREKKKKAIPEDRDCFKPGSPLRHKGGRKGLRRPSDLLRAMRMVGKTDKADNAETGLRRLCRKIKEEKPELFLSKLTLLEIDRARTLGKDKDAEIQRGLEGEGTAEKVVGELLEKWEKHRDGKK